MKSYIFYMGCLVEYGEGGELDRRIA